MHNEAPPGVLRPVEAPEPRAEGWYVILSELGHKLMSAGLLRQQAADGQPPTICDLPRDRAIYEDFRHTFVAHNIACECSHNVPRSDQGWATGMADALLPPGVRRLTPRVYNGQPATFYRYGESAPEYQGAIVVHARTRKHCEERNWPASWWHQVARFLLDAGAPAIICIGTLDAAGMVEGARDMRGVPLREQMNILASAWFALGTSSGPMHLASLCGCPHLVWCGGAQGEWSATKKRYEHTWNPFGTPVAAHPYNSWQPEPQLVKSWITAFVEKIGAYQNRNADKPRTAHWGGPVLA